jgi:hypothetical protein
MKMRTALIILPIFLGSATVANAKHVEVWHSSLQPSNACHWTQCYHHGYQQTTDVIAFRSRLHMRSGHLAAARRESAPSAAEHKIGSCPYSVVQTKAGPICVAAHVAEKFAAFINALPYTPKYVSCWAPGGHVAHSLHYTGEACDVDQSRRNVTSSAMYHVAGLASQFGLRDGCSFGDCGHVDTGVAIASRHHPLAYTRAASEADSRQSDRYAEHWARRTHIILRMGLRHRAESI